MEDAVEAIKMAFTMIVFAMALSVSMIAFSTTSAAAESIAYVSDKSNYYSNLQFVDEKYYDDVNYMTSRIVKADTVIPTLYRYYKENFSVKIYDGTGGSIKFIQLFDINTEGKVRTAVGKIAANRTPEEDALLDKFNNNTPSSAYRSLYMFEAPWIGDTITHTKSRIDLFVSSEAGYINNVFVDYSGDSVKIDGKTFKDIITYNSATDDYVFEEIFVKYTFSGDTISEGEGEDIETITGSKQPEDKVDITYIVKKVLK